MALAAHPLPLVARPRGEHLVPLWEGVTSEDTGSGGSGLLCITVSHLPLSWLPGPILLCCLLSGMLGTLRAFAQSETRFSSRTDSRVCFSSARGQPSPGGIVNAGCCLVAACRSSGLGDCPSADRDRAEPSVRRQVLFFVPVYAQCLVTTCEPGLMHTDLFCL